MTGFARSITGFSRRLNITCHNRHTTIVSNVTTGNDCVACASSFLKNVCEESDMYILMSQESYLYYGNVAFILLHATRSVC